MMPIWTPSGDQALSAGAAPLAIPEKSPPETGITACTINQETPTTSSCAGKTLEAGWKEKSPGSGYGVHALLEFALPNLGNNAIVLNAKLELYETAATTKTKVEMSVYRLTTPWASGATWKTTNGSTAWKNEGGDFEEAGSLINNENVGEASGAKTWYPTRLVQRWINGASAPGSEGSENLGLLIKDKPESEDSSNVVTFDGPAASTKYPTLTVEWVPRGIGASPHYTLLPVASSASAAEKVNPASGDLLATSTDLSIAAKGLTFHVARSYNSLAPSEPGYGAGWTDNNTEHLRVEGDGSVEYTDPSGATFEFIKNGGVLGTPPELAKEVVICLPGKEDTEGYFCPELPKGASYAVIYRATELAYYFGSGKGLLYPVSVEQYGIYKETAKYTTGDTLPTSWTDNAGAAIAYEESKTEGYTAVTFPAEGETVKYVEKENTAKAFKLVEYTSEQGQVTKYVYGTGSQAELLAEIIEPSGAQIKVAYNERHQVSKIEQIPAGQKSGSTTTYTYYQAGEAPAPCTASQKATVVAESGSSGEQQPIYCSNVLDEVIAALPFATKPPTISGKAVSEGTLTASNGSWRGTVPFTYSYQWYLCGGDEPGEVLGGKCEEIHGAEAATYQLTEYELGYTLRVAVTAHNAEGSEKSTSEPTAVVEEPGLEPFEGGEVEPDPPVYGLVKGELQRRAKLVFQYLANVGYYQRKKLYEEGKEPVLFAKQIAAIIGVLAYESKYHGIWELNPTVRQENCDVEGCGIGIAEWTNNVRWPRDVVPLAEELSKKESTKAHKVYRYPESIFVQVRAIWEELNGKLKEGGPYKAALEDLYAEGGSANIKHAWETFFEHFEKGDRRSIAKENEEEIEIIAHEVKTQAFEYKWG